MAMTPIGIINAGNPEQAYQDGYCIVGLQGDGFDRNAPAPCQHSENGKSERP
jgi:hypothetical protein